MLLLRANSIVFPTMNLFWRPHWHPKCSATHCGLQTSWVGTINTSHRLSRCLHAKNSHSSQTVGGLPSPGPSPAQAHVREQP
jgi:hypothetical protein